MSLRMWRALAVTLWCAAAVPAADWKPIDPAELADKKPRIDPSAPAEAMLWEVRVDNVDQRVYASQVQTAISQTQSLSTAATIATVLDNYLRIKIYNNVGRDRYSTIHISYSGTTKISDVSGRTIQPDGKILEVEKDAVFDGESFQVKSKSFAMPGVVPGSIIEYRWRETQPYIQGSQVLRMQRDLPVRLVRYLVKPSANIGSTAVQMFRANSMPLVKEPGGFFSTTMANVPAYKSEPFMPPYDEAATWLLVFYKKDNETEQQFWLARAKATYDDSRSQRWEADREVHRLAAELTTGAATAEEKVARLYDFCRLKIVNRTSPLATLEQRNSAKANENPGNTLKQRMGTARDIRDLFGALVMAAGFDARLAELPSRSRILSFNPSYPNAYFIGQAAVAVRMGEHWRLYDPASRYTPPSMLPWDRQGVYALISDAKNPVFVVTPMAAPEQSAVNYQGRFRLSEDGTLEGEGAIEYTGLQGVARKLTAEAQSDAARENAVKALLRRMPTAEVDQIKVENATDPDKPLLYRFHLRVPNYAQVLEKRILFAPAVFEQGVAAKFTAPDRTNEVSFDYPWMETDNLTIDFPDGYSFENGDMPHPFQIEGLGQYEGKAEVRGANQLAYSRRFTFGSGATVKFPVASYPSLKAAFDKVHTADNHTLVLRLAGSAEGR